MAEAANNLEQVAAEALYQGDTLAERFMEWVRTDLIWYAGSFTFHLLLLSSLLLLGNVTARTIQGEGPGFESAAPRGAAGKADGRRRRSSRRSAKRPRNPRN